MTLTGLVQSGAEGADDPPKAGLIRAVERARSNVRIRSTGRDQATTTEAPRTGKVPAVGFDASATDEYPAGRYPLSAPRGGIPAFGYQTTPGAGYPFTEYPPNVWFGSPYAPLIPQPRRRRAPLGLRIGVGILFLLAVGAVEVARAKPAWLPKNVDHPAQVVTPTAVAPRAMTLISNTPSQSVYVLPVSSFALSVAIDHRCWVLVKAVPGGGTLFSRTVEPGTPMPPTKVKGSASILVAARANAIVISDGTKTIGTIRSPLVGHTYVLEGR
jgi:hypothetical protein